jgi:uncharacterized protein YozE (UPF0346 family)
MEFWAEIWEDGLHPVYNSDYDQLKKLKLKTRYKFVVTQPRNPKFHRKGMALINIAFDNQERYNSFNELREFLIIDTGRYHWVTNFQGQKEKRANSISFSAMDNLEFKAYYSDLIDAVIRFLGTKREDLMQQVVDFD